MNCIREDEGTNWQVSNFVGDRRKRLPKLIGDTAQELVKIANTFSKWHIEEDPFAYNETASVSAFVSAWAMMGLASQAEVATSKRRADDHRKRGGGRIDAWCGCGNTAFGFEFKQYFPSGDGSGSAILAKLKEAVSDARRIDLADADERVGCLVTSFYYLDCAERRRALMDVLNETVSTRHDVAFSLETKDGRYASHFLFAKV